MKKIGNNKIYFTYTDEFIKKSKIIKKIDIFILNLWLVFSIIYKGSLLASYLNLIVLAIWATKFSNIDRYYEADRIYFDKGIIYFSKCCKYEFARNYKDQAVNYVDKVVITKRSIIIYGNVISTYFRGIKTCKKMKIPNAVKNSQEFKDYLEFKAKESKNESLSEKNQELLEIFKIYNKDKLKWEK